MRFPQIAVGGLFCETPDRSPLSATTVLQVQLLLQHIARQLKDFAIALDQFEEDQGTVARRRRAAGPRARLDGRGELPLLRHYYELRRVLSAKQMVLAIAQIRSAIRECHTLVPTQETFARAIAELDVIFPHIEALRHSVAHAEDRALLRAHDRKGVKTFIGGAELADNNTGAHRAIAGAVAADSLRLRVLLDGRGVELAIRLSGAEFDALVGVAQRMVDLIRWVAPQHPPLLI